MVFPPALASWDRKFRRPIHEEFTWISNNANLATKWEYKIVIMCPLFFLNFLLSGKRLLVRFRGFSFIYLRMMTDKIGTDGYCVAKFMHTYICITRMKMPTFFPVDFYNEDLYIYSRYCRVFPLFNHHIIFNFFILFISVFYSVPNFKKIFRSFFPNFFVEIK